MTLKRRDMLMATAAAVTLPSSVRAQTAAEDGDVQTFVLVHGTWNGGWIWQDTAAELRAIGHRVYTPTLTGCGARKHLATPDVGLDTHVTDVVNLIEYEELEDVVLVGHSFGGLVTTGVADRLRDRMKHLVYFDALVPAGIRMSGVRRTEDGELPEYWLKRRQKFIDGFMMDYWEDYTLDMLVPESAIEIRARLTRLITPHPARAWSDELVLENGGYEGLPRTYLHCVGQEFSPTSAFMYGPAKEPGWRFEELDIPRCGMLTHPKLVADVLAGLA